MIKSYIVRKITEISCWFGAATIISVLIFPTWVTVSLGVGMIVVSDTAIQRKIAEASPWIKEQLAKY